jgi:hypothetical protein
MSALAPLGFPVYDTLVPRTDAAGTYILLSTQTKNLERIGRGCRAWDASIEVQLLSIQPAGYASRAIVDDMEEGVLNALAGLSVEGFDQLDHMPDGSYSDAIDTGVQSVLRQVLKFRHVLTEREEEIEQTPAALPYALPLTL